MSPGRVAEHVQALEGVQDIDRRHGAGGADFLDADFGNPIDFLALDEHVRDGLGPICAIAKQAKIGQGLFRAAEPAFTLGELVAESDQEITVASSLVLR